MECGYCGCELPPRKPGTPGRPREYCTDSHRVMASRLRTAETVYDLEHPEGEPWPSSHLTP